MTLLGNPTFYGAWMDESLNKRIRDLAETLHSATFERRLLVQMCQTQSQEDTKAAKGSASSEKRVKVYPWET